MANPFGFVRTPMQILADLAATLTAAPRVPQLIAEMAANPNVREDIIRNRLAVHGLPQLEIDCVVAQYEQAKAAVKEK
jgi:hypothetical protein